MRLDVEAVFREFRSSRVVMVTSKVGFPNLKYQTGLRLRSRASTGYSSGFGTMARLSGWSGLVSGRGSRHCLLSAGIRDVFLLVGWVVRRALSAGAVAGAEEVGAGSTDLVVLTSSTVDDFVGFVGKYALVFGV